MQNGFIIILRVRRLIKYKQCNYTDINFHRAIKQYAKQNLIIKYKLLTRTSSYKKICEESMGDGCRQTLLRVETCAHYVLTGTYDKRCNYRIEL